ncbi:MAG: dUTP diphosphatase [Patescibacteria group bacterium]|nr:dUTP diphosphatase [Patescibacteria group bacterium]
MSNYSGKFIVIDGTDGSGKTTQLQLLASKLSAERYDVEIADFPQYNTKSAGMVEEYLSGKYGGADDVNPYAASIFYAIDRFDASKQIREWLKQGKIVISNRYISASFAHQGGKIDNPLERKLFFNWLSEIEYKIFNIPKPDLSLILHVEAEVSQKMAKDRQREDWKGKTKDIHEDNLQHLKKAEKAYIDIAQNLPDFKLIKCTRNGEIMSREDIHYLVWLHANRIISVGSSQRKPDFQAMSDLLVSKGKLGPNLPELAHTPKISVDQMPSQTLSVSQERALAAHPEDEENIGTTKLINSEAKIKINEESTFTSNDVLREIIVERLQTNSKLPTRSHVHDAGLDLYAAEDCSIPPYGQDTIATGIKIAIPTGYVGLIWDKSGLASQGFTTMGGVIDASYRGEIKVVFKNLSEDIYNIQTGQKIAQLLIQKITTPTIKEAKVEDNSSRGEDGFGSTGLF